MGVISDVTQEQGHKRDGCSSRGSSAEMFNYFSPITMLLEEIYFCKYSCCFFCCSL